VGLIVSVWLLFFVCEVRIESWVPNLWSIGIWIISVWLISMSTRFRLGMPSVGFDCFES
jgi:type IV secretory pathway TrbD component